MDIAIEIEIEVKFDQRSQTFRICFLGGGGKPPPMKKAEKFVTACQANSI